LGVAENVFMVSTLPTGLAASNGSAVLGQARRRNIQEVLIIIGVVSKYHMWGPRRKHRLRNGGILGRSFNLE
jgi:hypothetical protein